jgi:hypothetical protein
MPFGRIFIRALGRARRGYRGRDAGKDEDTGQGRDVEHGRDAGKGEDESQS